MLRRLRMFDLPILEGVNLQVPYVLKDYEKGEILFREGDTIKDIGIVIFGTISVETLTIDGFSFAFNTMSIGSVFGDALVYQERPLLPGTFVALTPVRLLLISRNNFKKLLEDDHVFLFNYLKMNAIRNINEQYTIKLYGQPSIREKILFYLKEEMKKTGSKTVKLSLSKEKLASFLALNRPSLSRELMRMRNEGLIAYDRKSITYLGSWNGQ